jgi:hypothetical protein
MIFRCFKQIQIHTVQTKSYISLTTLLWLKNTNKMLEKTWHPSYDYSLVMMKGKRFFVCSLNQIFAVDS